MKKADADIMRSTNRRAVLSALRNNGAMARVDIGAALSLSPAAVSGITADFLAEGVLLELDSKAEPAKLARGRPRILLNINPNSALFVGLRLTFDRLDVFLGDALNNLVEHAVYTTDTRALTAEQLVDFIVAGTNSLLEKRSRNISDVAGVGIAVQGIVNETQGRIRWSPVLTCTPVNLGEALERRFSVPVTMDNDANTLALAHCVDRPGAQTGTTISVMIGYGVGMGIVINGEIYRGNRGSAAEFGHMKTGLSVTGPLCRCGARGCIEASVGDYAIYRDACELLGKSPEGIVAPDESSMVEIGEMGRGGHTGILELFDHAGTVLGIGVSNIVNLLAPDTVLITGAGTRSFDLMRKNFEQAMDRAVLTSVRDITKIEVMDWNLDFDGKGTVAMAIQHWLEERSNA